MVLKKFGRRLDPFTPEEILEIDCYCNLRGIELVPCIASFGHLYDLLRSESFGKYREMNTGIGETFTMVPSHEISYH